MNAEQVCVEGEPPLLIKMSKKKRNELYCDEQTWSLETLLLVLFTAYS